VGEIGKWLSAEFPSPEEIDCKRAEGAYDGVLISESDGIFHPAILVHFPMTHRENQGLTRRYTFLQVGERKEVGQVRMPR